MNFVKYTTLITFIVITTHSWSQQDPNRTFFRYHMNLINPAYAGTSETTDIGINFRSQWISVSGAPETQTAFLSKATGNNVGLGLSIINDQTFIEKQTSVNADFSYAIKISEKTKVYLGVKAGLNSYNANTTGLVTYGGASAADPAINNFNGGFKPNLGTGLLLKGENYFLSVSTPNLITTTRLEEENGTTKLGSSKSHYYLGAGYDFVLSSKLIFKPAVLLRYVENAPFSLDCNGTFSFNKRLELGASYRLYEGLGGLLIFNADHWLDLGYAYQTSSDTPLQNANNGTHEVFLLFKL